MSVARDKERDGGEGGDWLVCAALLPCSWFQQVLHISWLSLMRALISLCASEEDSHCSLGGT